MKKYILLILTLMPGVLQVVNAQNDDTVSSPCISEIGENSLLDVFPNPTEGTFQIVYSSATTCPPDGWGGTLIINISNSNFKTVYTETILEFDGEYSKTIDLRLEGSDVYLIEVVAGKQKKSKHERVY